MNIHSKRIFDHILSFLNELLESNDLNGVRRLDEKKAFTW